MEAPRYPEDYDGIVAGNPALDWNNLMIMQLWNSRANLGGPGEPMSAFGTTPEEATPKVTLLNQAVIDACDANDGLEDGLVDASLSCSFNPEILRCEGVDGPDCLTEAQVEAARKIYAGPTHAVTGEQVHSGEPLSGELSWLNLWVGRPTVGGSGGDYFPYTVKADPDYDFRLCDFGSDVDDTRGKVVAGGTMDENMNATDPDLAPFRDRGGKMIMYSGWADGFVTPIRAVEYYEEVVRTLGEEGRGGNGKRRSVAGARKDVGRFSRFFMAPGWGTAPAGRASTPAAASASCPRSRTRRATTSSRRSSAGWRPASRRSGSRPRATWTTTWRRASRRRGRRACGRSGPSTTGPAT